MQTGREERETLTQAAIKINEAPVVGVSFRPSLRGDERGMFEERDLPCSISWFGPRSLLIFGKLEDAAGRKARS